MKKLIVGCSPITSEIFAGTLLKDGRTWSANKQDVTATAVGAVAQHLLQKDESMEFTYKGERYQLKVERLDLSCSECGSRELYIFENGDKRCNECNHEW